MCNDGTRTLGNQPDLGAGLGQAIDMLLSANLDEGITLLRELPESPDVSYWLGRALMRRHENEGTGEIELAHELLAASVQAEPTPTSWHWQGWAGMQMGREMDAVACYEQARALEPGFVPSRVNLLPYSAVVDPEATRTDIAALLKEVPRDRFQELAREQWMRSTWDEWLAYLYDLMAVSWNEQAKQSAPRNHGQVDRTMRLTAISWWARSLKIVPTHRMALIELADICLNDHDCGGAVALLDLAPASCPEAAKLKGVMALRLELAGNIREALTLVDDALDTPSLPDDLHTVLKKHRSALALQTRPGN